MINFNYYKNITSKIYYAARHAIDNLNEETFDI